jgi:hypothetical protein
MNSCTFSPTTIANNWHLSNIAVNTARCTNRFKTNRSRRTLPSYRTYTRTLKPNKPVGPQLATSQQIKVHATHQKLLVQCLLKMDVWRPKHVEQRFPNFFQVGTTIISQNVLRTALILSSLKVNCLRFSTTVFDTQFTLILFFPSFFGLMFNLRGPQG